MKMMNTCCVVAAMIAPLVLSASAQTWTADSNLTDSDGGSYLTANNSHGLAAYDDRIFLVWHDFYQRPNMGCQIKFKMYDGQAWSSDTVIGFIGNKNLNNWYPSCAANAGTFYLAWETNEFTTDIENFEIAFRSYENGTWAGITRLTKNPELSTNPAMAVSTAGRAYIFWQDHSGTASRIKYKTFYGSSWSAETTIKENSDYCGMASVTLCQDLPAVVWEDYDEGTFQVRFKKMGAAGWGPDSSISHSVLGAFSPAVAVDDSHNLHVVWQDWSLSGSRICYRRLSAASGQWEAESTISPMGYRTESPVIVCRDSWVDVFWSDDRSGYYEIYRRMFSNGNWGPEERMTDQASTAILPGVVADTRGNLHLAWTGDQPLASKSPDIFIKSLYLDPWPSRQRIPAGVVPPLVCEIQAYPNPASDRSVLKYSVIPSGSDPARQSPTSYPGRIDVYNISGQLVNTLFLGTLSQGERFLEWSVRDRSGAKVPSGIYFAKITTGQVSAVAKIMVVR